MRRIALGAGALFLFSSAAHAQASAAVAAGAMHFHDGGTERAVTAALRWRFLHGLVVGVSPTYAHATAADSLGGASRSGFADLPLEAGIEHSFAGHAGASIGATFVVTLPTADSASGFGGGAVGYSIGVGLGLVPAPRTSLHLGAGRSLTDFSLQSSFGGSASGWGDAELGYTLSDRASISGGVSSDLGAVDSLEGHSRSLAAGISFQPFSGPLGITLGGSHGISGQAPPWTLSLSVGTDWVGLAQVTAAGSPLERLAQVFGGGNKGQGNGRGRGSTTSPGNSGGKGKKP
ncbi:MAG: hypothetical protein JWO05_1381 [Gemmatimonadetes bacterium]|nr:hypothetical protein [Gemmatimonadota bacterium]